MPCRIFVDAVFNQMTPGSGRSVGGATNFNGGSMNFPGRIE